MKAILLLMFAAVASGQTLTNPNCPNATAAAGVMPHCASLTWAAPSASSPPAGYNIYRTTTSGGCSSTTAATCTKITTALVASLSFTDNSNPANVLTEGPTFFYVVTSVYSSGEFPGAPISGTFPPVSPGPPTNITGAFK